MIFVTTGTKDIFELTGIRLIESFLKYKNDENHSLVYFFEDLEEPYRDTLPQWIPIEYFNNSNLHFVNLMTYEYKDKGRLVDFIDKNLSKKIDYFDEYSSERSVKWFRPVARILYASELFNENFCSIDSDCEFIDCVDESIFDDILNDYNLCYLGRKHFKVMRHGGYNNNGEYVETNRVPSTDKDTHMESGFIGFNMNKNGTRDFIKKNTKYWINGEILNLKYRTDCHTFDATIDDLSNLKYNNLLLDYGEVSPIGSRVLEVSPMGKYLIHHKGTLGPELYRRGLL